MGLLAKLLPMIHSTSSKMFFLGQWETQKRELEIFPYTDLYILGFTMYMIKAMDLRFEKRVFHVLKKAQGLKKKHFSK